MGPLLGATAKGGVNRQALTDLDKQGRDLFLDWCRAAGCSIRIDSAGNIFARRAGKRNDLPAGMTGSHLDTQPTGGKFDGLFDLDVETERPVEVTVWTNEEGCRFAPAMMGSGLFVGKFDAEATANITDQDGKSFAEELERIGYRGSDVVKPEEIGAFFEVHIEQGPILEAEKRTIGIVTGAQGQRWFDVTVTGQEAHAGPTPMEIRRDALVGASRIVQAVNRIGLEHLPRACATVGQFVVTPNSRNTIPGRVAFSVDFRHPDDDRLSSMKAALEGETKAICDDIGLELELTEIWYQPPLKFAEDCIAAVRQGAEASGFEGYEIVSGAGHDPCHIAGLAPTAMIFIPCEDGISHNEVENATRDDCAAGCNVLLHAMVERANTL